ncbi:MAG TPA: serine/threonine-protein kinase [Polyangiaceae bacterium]
MLQVPPPERQKGQVVAGRFRLVDQIGRGGMGSVWTAHHLTLKVDVAVKFMDGAFHVGDESMLKRFQKEATAAASIQSPNVVKILDYGKDESGRPYLAMELLRGEELEQRVEREGPLALQLMKKVIVETCRGLAAAHAAGVIHRDLKPENVFLCRDVQRADESGAFGEVSVKLLDFGIARADRELSGTGNLTITGQLLGTPMFMSPEQALGRKDVDGRSDLYSLGVVAYKCLTGKPPYEESETVGEIIVSITTKEPRDPTLLRKDLPPSVVAWLKKALDKNRDARFQTAKDMADAFAQAVDVRRMAVSFSGLDVDDTSRPRLDFDEAVKQTTRTSEPPRASEPPSELVVPARTHHSSVSVRPAKPPFPTAVVIAVAALGAIAVVIVYAVMR